MAETPRISVELTEEESRMLGAVMVAVLPHLNPEQRSIAHEVCAKFVIASEEQAMALLCEHGPERAEEIAKEILAAHPKAGDPVRLAPAWRQRFGGWVRSRGRRR